MLKPLYDNVILKKEEVEKETTTANGIILTDNAENVPSYATVVAIGSDSGVDIEGNDKVVYKEYSDTNVELDEEGYIIIEAKDILTVSA